MEGVHSILRMFCWLIFFFFFPPIRDNVFMQPLLKEFVLISAIIFKNFRRVLERSVPSVF